MTMTLKLKLNDNQTDVFGCFVVSLRSSTLKKGLFIFKCSRVIMIKLWVTIKVTDTGARASYASSTLINYITKKQSEPK